MIFWGIKSKTLREGSFNDVHCEYCNETETYMEYTFIQKYFHLYFIPLFPLRKKTVVYCDDCGVEYYNRKIPKEAAKKLNHIQDRFPIRTPIWTFSGLFIITLFFCWAFYQSDKHEVVEGDYVKNPKKGDVYYTEFKPLLYSTLRIDKVDKNNIYFTYNDTSVIKYTKVFFITGDKYYSDKKGIFTRQKLERLYKKDSIISVTRK